MWMTKLSPTAFAGSPVASSNMPDASIITWPIGSLSTRKIADASASIVRWTSIRSVTMPHPRTVPRRGPVEAVAEHGALVALHGVHLELREEHRVGQIGAPEVGAAEVSTDDVGPSEVDAPEVRADEVCAS